MEGLEEQGHFLGLGNQFGVCDDADPGPVTSCSHVAQPSFLKRDRRTCYPNLSKIKSSQFLKVYT